MYNKYLAELSKEQLLELIELYAKNWLAHDGVWQIRYGRGHVP